MTQKAISRRQFLIGSAMTAAAAALAACAPAATTAPTTAPAGPTATTAQGATEPTATVEATFEPVLTSIPRNQTLYINGQQWNPINGWNPYSSSMNNALAVAPGDNSRVIMFETPYLFNMLDGKQYPFLADGPWEWNSDMTQITFKIKTAAKWSDGTPVTADDVAYTWASYVKYGATAAANFSAYVDTVVAVDAQTVQVNAKLDDSGKAVNPLQVFSYLSNAYVIQKAWTQTLEARISGDSAKFLADPAEDVVYSGPYHKFFVDDTKVIFVRDDNYWGQDASMWGKLPIPKYIGHAMFKDNDAGTAAFQAGQVDVSQEFISNVQDLWLKQNLPISTYLPDAPYDIAASLPTAYYNMASYGLDQVAIRKAIAIAVDYNTIIANAMTNQSPTFSQAPRSLMNPTPGEQALYDQAAVADLQWVGNDVAGANKLLDDAGIAKGSDGLRQYNGKTLHYVATCPNGWTDWMAAIEVVAAAGAAIGIDITTNYPEWNIYQTQVTNWPLPATGFDIFMMYNDGAGPAEPWSRTNHLLNSMFAETKNNWSGDWGGYKNPDIDALLNALPAMTDTAKIKDAYTQITKMYLTDVPSFTLMYRPQYFHTVNESVWTNFPHQNDGTNPPVPPTVMTDGWGVAALYNVKLVSG